MNYAVAEMMLGYTRINGVVAFNSDTKEFLEITPAVARKLIDQGQLKGLKWRNTDNGTEFMCDAEGWNQQNIPVKTACGKFRPMLNDYPGVNINSMYTVVRVIDTDYRGRLYEIISNKCARVKVTEQNIRELSAITNVAGVWVSDTEVKIADGVVYEDRRASAKEKAVEVDQKEISASSESDESSESNKSSAVIESGDDFDRLVEEIAREIVEAEEEKRRAGIIEDTTPLLSEEQQAEVDAQVEAAFRAKLEEEKAESETTESEATAETTEPEATVTEEPTEEEKVESETTESEATTETTEQVNKKNNSSKSKRKASGKR